MLSRRRKFIRERVESLLTENAITGPKVPVERIAARHGIDIRTDAVDGDISGFLVRQVGKAGAIIGINRNQSPKRRRFTLGHELGHYFLHNEQGNAEVHVDRSSRFFVKLRDSDSSKGEDTDEMEANLFAAELLMPAKFLEVDIARHGGFDLSEDDDTVGKLAERYGVSTQAMSYRLAYLGWTGPER